MHFGVNINNREPLIAPDYTLSDLLNLAETVEAYGFDSVWVGDSLFSKPRYEPIALLSAISQRTRKVKLGTACMVSGTRDPLYLALEWTTLDHLSNGRTILGTGMGNPEEGVRREYAAVGLDFEKRARIFEEGLAVLRELWTAGKTSFQGEHFRYDDVSFYSGTEMGPLMPVQTPPPIWVVSNPRLTVGTKAEEQTSRVISKAARRIATYGDGWMTCCRARHPEEFAEQLAQIHDAIDEIGRPRSEYVMSYQVTMNIADTRDGPPRMGSDRHTRRHHPVDRDIRGGRRGLLHLPLRLARSVRSGGALREGRAAAGHGEWVMGDGDVPSPPTPLPLRRAKGASPITHDPSPITRRGGERG
jgi:alkanesulfonate monooxygenase SsuD/methylene tetrahydromethanopterin reductase-like flavin-dependent oxidoreductase (luciferase family)